MSENKDKLAQRGIYLLPNLLTTAALFAGFYAIVAALKGLFDTAAVAIFIAMVADGLDGRVARMTNTQSEFGAQYDSLSDLAAFGIAPSLVLYSWSLIYLGKLGWCVAFIYTAATALRLARFNSKPALDKRYFQGLPCTLAAGVMAGLIWLGTEYSVDGEAVAIPLALMTLTIALLMVSSTRYYSFKQLDMRGKVSFITAVVAVFLVTAVAFRPAEVLFGILVTYAISGPIYTLCHILKVRKLRKNRQ